MGRQGVINLIAAFGILVVSASAGQAPPGSRSDEDAIRAVIAATTDAFSRHDAKAWVKFCTPDAPRITAFHNTIMQK